jgi:hypothetical protein
LTGNEFVNSIYEANMPSTVTKPQSTADRNQREEFITAKYKDKKFMTPTDQSVEQLSKV